MTTRERGFTLVELIVVVVLGALVLGAALQVLVTNQRTYTAQNAQIRSQQGTRMALDVITAEMRELSAAGGDLLGMSADTMRVRVMRRFGLVCTVDLTGQPELTTLKVGGWFVAGDSVAVFADNDVNSLNDDAWIYAKISQVDTTQLCGAQAAQELTFSGQRGLFEKPGGDSVRVGAPVRSYVYYTYGLFNFGGESYLGRREPGRDPVPLVGPIKSGNGLQFRYLDQFGRVTTVRTDVRQIEVTVRTTSNVLNSLGEMVSDSVLAIVYTRN